MFTPTSHSSRVIALAFTGLLAAATLTSCAASTDASESPENPAVEEFGVEVDEALHEAVPEKYRENGVNVAVYNDFAPDEWLENDELKGWSVDLARAAAAKLGLDFTYDPVSFEVILPGLENGRFDLGVTSFSPLPERRLVLDFVGQRQDGGSYATRADADFTIEGPMDLCGRTVGAIAGGYERQLLDPISEECVAAGEEPVSPQEYKTQSETILAVESGRAEVVSTGTTTLGYAIGQKGGNFTLSPWVNGVVYNSMGVRKDDPLGQSMVDAINALIDDGVYMEIMEKYDVEKAGTIEESVLITEDSPE